MRAFVNLLLFLTVLSAQTAFSQAVSTDSLFYDRPDQKSLQYFVDTLATPLSLYNGIEHPGYFRSIKGFAYLDSEEMIEGRVNYDDVWYSIPMLYDLHAERLIIMHFNKFHKISLINEKVKEFVLHDHLFRNLSISESGKNGLMGMYEVLFEGDSISVYAKKRKLLNEQSTSHGLEREFISNDHYYMFLDGAFHQVKSKRDMFALMGNRKKDVVAELRRNKIKFKKNKEKALITASKVYDEKI